MLEQSYVLGIDLGTTSIKACLIDARTRKQISQKTECTKAHLETEVLRDEQCPHRIVRALQDCLASFDPVSLSKVTRIGVCGQMHGVVLWKPRPWTYEPSSGRFALDRDCVSRLVTWQDRRCSKEFLASLPRPSTEDFAEPHSGFGCATLFWMQRENCLPPAEFTCAGTIQDLVVAMLTGRDRPVMSAQNAASFGYFDADTNRWDTEALSPDTGFPSHLLPDIAAAEKPAGVLQQSWCGIPPQAVVFPALGDTQCSVFSALRDDRTSALLLIGTSAQLSLIVDRRWPTKAQGHYSFFPYFNGKSLCLAASLNGGNVLSHFVAMLQSWMEDLGVSLAESAIWDRIRRSSRGDDRTPNPASETDLRVRPLLFGERHNPHADGVVTGLTPAVPSLERMFRSVCSGLIENLIEMLPLEALRAQNIGRVLCAGRVICGNEVLSDEIKRLFRDFSVEFNHQCDSAFGSALAAAMANLETRNVALNSM